MTAEELVDTFVARITRWTTTVRWSSSPTTCEYDNVPISKVSGPEGIRSVFAQLDGMGMDAMEWVVHHQVADRLDRDERAHRPLRQRREVGRGASRRGVRGRRRQDRALARLLRHERHDDRDDHRARFLSADVRPPCDRPPRRCCRRGRGRSRRSSSGGTRARGVVRGAPRRPASTAAARNASTAVRVGAANAMCDSRKPSPVCRGPIQKSGLRRDAVSDDRTEVHDPRAADRSRAPCRRSGRWPPGRRIGWRGDRASRHFPLGLVAGWSGNRPTLVADPGGATVTRTLDAGRCISADSHVTEPPRSYVDRIDPKYRDRAPGSSTTTRSAT